MAPTLNRSCLIPSSHDIIVNGVRYGVVWKIDDYDIWRRKPVTKWRARFDTPDQIEYVTYRWFLEPYFSEAEIMEDALFLAFEEFVCSNNLPEDECARIDLALHGDEVTDVLAKLALETVSA